MNMLASLKNEEGVKVESEKDTLGGFTVLESDAYKAKIDMAYITTSAETEAMGLVIIAKLENGGEYSTTLWMTSGKAKGKKTYYTDKNGVNKSLPGFLHANSIAMLTTGKEISDLEPEEKTIKVYNKEAGAQVPTKVQAIMEMIGQDVYFGVLKDVVDKTVKNDAGEYVPTGDTREQNELDKVFCAKEGFDKMTRTEIEAKAETPEFFNSWVAKNKGQVRQRAKGTSAGNGTAGAPAKAGAAAAGTAKPKTSLFGG